VASGPCAPATAAPSAPAATEGQHRGSRPRWPGHAERYAPARRPRARPGRERRAMRQRLVLGLEGPGLGDRVGADQLIQHDAPSGLGGLGAAVRSASLGRLRQGDQQGLLAVGQAGRLVAEIAEAGGPRAFQIAAIGGQGQVQRQDLALGQPRLQLHGADHLDQLRAEVARARLQQARGLHGQGRGAGRDAAVDRRRADRPDQRQRVDPQVLVEPCVLDLDQALLEGRVGAMQVRADAPSPVLDRQGAQPGAASVQGDWRGVPGSGHVRREDGAEGEEVELGGEQADKHLGQRGTRRVLSDHTLNSVIPAAAKRRAGTQGPPHCAGPWVPDRPAGRPG
jgi:hypothetical protein